MFHTNVVQKIKPRILCCITIPENIAVYEIMWKNIVRPGGPQMTWRMRIARWISNAKNAHSEYVILITFPLQRWLHERALMISYTYTVCLSVLFKIAFQYACIFVCEHHFIVQDSSRSII
jgi:hypothetical protein